MFQLLKLVLFLLHYDLFESTYLYDLKQLNTAISVNSTQQTLFYIVSIKSFQDQKNVKIKKVCLTVSFFKNQFHCSSPNESSFVWFNGYMNDGIVNANIEFYDSNQSVIYSSERTFFVNSVSVEADIAILIQPTFTYSSIQETTSTLYFTLFYDEHVIINANEIITEIVGKSRHSVSSTTTELYSHKVEPGSYFFLLTPIKSKDLNDHVPLKGYTTSTYLGKYSKTHIY
jgi:hypothetical protein